MFNEKAVTSKSSFTLRDVPVQDRPRERMLRFGASSLSDSELLAVLLRTGTINESAVTLAQRVLKEASGLRNIPDMSVTEMTKYQRDRRDESATNSCRY